MFTDMDFRYKGVKVSFLTPHLTRLPHLLYSDTIRDMSDWLSENCDTDEYRYIVDYDYNNDGSTISYPIGVLFADSELAMAFKLRFAL